MKKSCFPDASGCACAPLFLLNSWQFLTAVFFIIHMLWGGTELYFAATPTTGRSLTALYINSGRLWHHCSYFCSYRSLVQLVHRVSYQYCNFCWPVRVPYHFFTSLWFTPIMILLIPYLLATCIVHPHLPCNMSPRRTTAVHSFNCGAFIPHSSLCAFSDLSGNLIIFIHCTVKVRRPDFCAEHFCKHSLKHRIRTAKPVYFFTPSCRFQSCVPCAGSLVFTQPYAMLMLCF